MRYASLALLCLGCSAASVPRDAPDAVFGAKVSGFTSPDPAEHAQCPLPEKYHQRNKGGSDGAGLCVYASAKHTGRWQSNAAFTGLFDWMTRYAGGSYPAKFKATLEAFCREKGYPVPKYVQIQDSDLEILKLACRNRYMPGVTYGFSPSGRYGGQRISHMVSLVHASDNWFGILDNNYPGEKNIEWLTPKEFKATYTSPGGKGWAIVLLENPPPPMPYTKGK